MQELRWMEPLPDHTLEGGLRLLDELKWNIKVTEADQHWYVNGEHVRFLKTSSRESVDAFLYGLALAYSAMPREILNQLRQWVKAATE
jgi:hypothetical protein